MKPTVWFDVTDFIEWNGFLTGVQRVVYENVVRAHEDDRITAKLCRYNRTHNDIEEVDFDTVFAQSEMNQQVQHPGTDYKMLIKRRLIKVRDDLPQVVRRQLTPNRQEALKRTAKRAYSIARTSRQAVRDTLKRTVTETGFVPAPIQNRDTLVIIGKLWDYPSYVELLAEKKRTVGFRYLQLIHDIIPVYQRHLFGDGLFEPFSNFLFEAMSNCDQLISISQSTTDDLTRFAKDLNFELPPISRIQLGDTPRIPAKPIKPAFVGDAPFILSVGTVEARKNHILLYETYKLAAERKITLPRLYVVGGRGWLTENMVYMTTHDHDTSGLISFHSGIIDAELKWLYENCRFTVYPSVYEGWGLPVRESFSYKKPCITTKRSSLEEAGGKFATYVSGYDPSEMIEAITGLMTTSDAYKLVSTYVPYTWNQSYEQMAAILRN